MPAPTPDPALLRYEDVCGILGVARSTVNVFVARKQLRVVNLGYRTKRFRRSDVDSFLARRAGELRQ